MSLHFSPQIGVRDTRCPGDKIFSEPLSVCYTLLTDDITRGEKPASTPYSDRLAPFREEGGALVCDEAEARLEVREEGGALHFSLSSRSEKLSAFGICLPFFFMGKKGGCWQRQFLLNSPYIAQDGDILYAYLTKPSGEHLVAAVKGGAAGWKMDYSPYLGGHYFLNLKFYANFDRAYRTPRRAQRLDFSLFPVRDFRHCLSVLARFYGVPFLDYDVNGGACGTEIALRAYGRCTGFLKAGEGVPRKGRSFRAEGEGESELAPLCGKKRGAPVTVYAFKDIFSLYKRSMDAVDPADVAKTDGNLCEHQCWAPAMLRLLLLRPSLLTARESQSYRQRVKELLDVVTETDPAKAVERRTILASPHEGLPAYNIFRSTRIQEEFFGITLLLDAFRVFGDEKYYEYAVRTTDSLLLNYQKEDGRLERPNGKVREDYTTVCCPMIPLADMANFLKGRDPARSEKYFAAAGRMAEYLFRRGMSFPTEGGSASEAEPETEEGSVSCTALALLYYCRNVKREERYIRKAKEILDAHENWVIRAPLCQMHGSTLRWWETQWEGDADGPAICAGHAWTIWRAEADYLYSVLTGDAAHRIKAYNGFMTNLSKIRPDGKSYAVYNPDMINGGGFHSRSEEVRFSLASRFPRQTDSGLSRYVWVRLADTFLKDDTFTPFPQEKI